MIETDRRSFDVACRSEVNRTRPRSSQNCLLTILSTRDACELPLQSHRSLAVFDAAQARQQRLPDEQEQLAQRRRQLAARDRLRRLGPTFFTGYPFADFSRRPATVVSKYTGSGVCSATATSWVSPLPLFNAARPPTELIRKCLVAAKHLDAKVQQANVQRDLGICAVQLLVGGGFGFAGAAVCAVPGKGLPQDRLGSRVAGSGEP